MTAQPARGWYELSFSLAGEIAKSASLVREESTMYIASTDISQFPLVGGITIAVFFPSGGKLTSKAILAREMGNQ